MEIKGNGHFREIFYGYELSEKERKEFDYLNNDEIDNLPMFRYKGSVYSLNSIMSLKNSVHNNSGNDKDSEFYGYDGYSGDSYFSGILVKFNESCDMVQVYTYYS